MKVLKTTSWFAAALLMAAAATSVARAQSSGSTGNAENGKRLFLRDGCWECHGYAGQGSRDGARLANTALTTAQATRYVRRPSGAMPAYIDKVITDEEFADIWAYVKTLPVPKAVKDIPLLNELKGP
jgi:mono/diheme cytochrome c family protein